MQENIKKITAYLFGLKFLGLFVSLFVLSLSAKFFGVSEERDIWLLVSSFFMALAGATFGPINETFRAKFTHLKGTEETESLKRKLNSLIGFIIIIGIVLSLIIFLFPNYLVYIIAPTLEGVDMFNKMLLILIPSLLLNQLIYLGIGILNIHNVFYIPEIVGFFSAFINLICIYILAPIIGIYSLIVSQYIYLFLYLIVVLCLLYKKDVVIRPVFLFKWNDVKPFVFFSLPFFFPYFIGQCNLIVEKNLASTLGQGVVSILDYSRRFSTILQTVLTSVLASVMVTKLTHLYTQDESREYSKYHTKFLEITNLILCLSIPILIGSAPAISKLFFMRGDINQNDIIRISELMQIYSFSFVGIALYLFFGLTLLTQMRGKLYAILGVSAQILTMIINIFFYQSLRDFVFPISVGLGHFSSALIMFYFIKSENKKEEFRIILKTVFYIIFVAIVIYVENLFIEIYDPLIILTLNIITLLMFSFFVLLPIMKINGFELLKTWKNKI